MKIIQYLRRKMREAVIGELRLVDPRLYEALGVNSTAHSGHSVTPDTALHLTTVWSCVRLISETIATLPLPVYRIDKNGRKNPAYDHPLYPVLHDMPNWNMTACEFWECMVASICLWGNAYAKKTYTKAGKLTELDPLRPDWMHVYRNARNAIVYRYPDATSAGGFRDYREEEIFHLKGFGNNGLTGLSPISYARHSLGNAMAIEQAAGSAFKNMVAPIGVLTSDQLLSKAQQDQYLAGLADKFQGAMNAGKIMPLMAGFKFQPVSINPEDMQMLESRAFSVEEICRIFRVPPFMVGHHEKSTSWGTGIEQQLIAFQALALRPYLVRIEQAIRKSLISPEEWGQVTAEFNLEGLLRADSHGRAEFYAVMVEKGIFTRNEVRAKENMPPQEGGDRLTVQINNTFLDLLGTQPAPATQTDAPETVQ